MPTRDCEAPRATIVAPLDVTAELERAAASCARDGAQLTALRSQVLRLVLEADGPMTAYQLLDRLRVSHKGAAPPTVYRAIEFLMERRLVHKIESLNAFVFCHAAGRRHAAQFLICRTCGSAVEIDDAATNRAIGRAAQRNGFHPSEAIVEIEGVCSACHRTQ